MKINGEEYRVKEDLIEWTDYPEGLNFPEVFYFASLGETPLGYFTIEQERECSNFNVRFKRKYIIKEVFNLVEAKAFCQERLVGEVMKLMEKI